jgi:hypothetical protein
MPAAIQGRSRANTSEEQIGEIKSILEDIKNLLLLTNQDKLDEMKRRLLRPGSVEATVYDLCDGTNTSQEIAAKIQKSPEYAGAVLSNLRRKGLVKTTDRDGKRVSVQAF